MIPVSRDTRLPKTIAGVTYQCLPPVGDLEIELIALSGEAATELSPQYEAARAAVLAEIGDAPLPDKKEMIRRISKKMQETAAAAANGGAKFREDAKKVDQAVDLFLTGWEGPGVPEFPTGGRPSAMMKLKVKKELYEWYFEQFDLGVEELKN